MKIAIILVNYKDYASRFLAECRDSLRTQTYPKDMTRIYIVDNASTDETLNFLKLQFPEAVLIPRADGNYAAANNTGLKKALEDGCDLIVFANIDVRFDPDWLKELSMAAGSNPEIGIVQSKILLYPKTGIEHDNPKINTLGNAIHYLGFGTTTFYGMSDKLMAAAQGNEVREIKGYASGCSLAIKKEVIERIGGYNEEYYMYHDDIELSWKTRLAGWKIVLAPRSVVYHKYEFERSVQMLYYMERNRWLVFFSFYQIKTIFLLLPALIIMDLGMLAFSLLKGWFPTKLKVYDYFLRPNAWEIIKASREEIARMRVVSDKDAVEGFTGALDFEEIANPVLKYIANPLLSLYWQIIKPLIMW